MIGGGWQAIADARAVQAIEIRRATMPPLKAVGKISRTHRLFCRLAWAPSIPWPVPPDGVLLFRPSTKSSARGKCERLFGCVNRFGLEDLLAACR